MGEDDLLEAAYEERFIAVEQVDYDAEDLEYDDVEEVPACSHGVLMTHRCGDCNADVGRASLVDELQQAERELR